MQQFKREKQERGEVQSRGTVLVAPWFSAGLSLGA